VTFVTYFKYPRHGCLIETVRHNALVKPGILFNSQAPMSQQRVDAQIQLEEPNPYPVGSHVALRLTDGTLLSLQIIKPFLPFTKSQVYLVRPETTTWSNGLPHEIILKVFDPRYDDGRIPPQSGKLPRLWTLEAETAAALYRQEIAEGKRPDVITVHPPYTDGDAMPYLWEEYFYRYSVESSENEIAALTRLISLQGTLIPKLYGSGHVVPPMHTRRIQPPAVLIEYIHGTNLADYNAAKLPNIPPAIFRPLFDAIRKFKDLGVFHGDIDGRNILVSPSEAPTRAVLIDFGRAGVREDEELEEDWIWICTFYSDETKFELALKANGVCWP
jgi:serine/threonine protein kinase